MPDPFTFGNTSETGFNTGDPPVIAEKTCEVKVEINGATNTYIVQEGQPVPPDLVDDYREQHGKKAGSKSDGKDK